MTDTALKPLQSKAASLVCAILAMHLRINPERIEVELDMSDLDEAKGDDQKFGVRVRIDGTEPTPEQSQTIERTLAMIPVAR